MNSLVDWHLCNFDIVLRFSARCLTHGNIELHRVLQILHDTNFVIQVESAPTRVTWCVTRHPTSMPLFSSESWPHWHSPAIWRYTAVTFPSFVRALTFSVFFCWHTTTWKWRPDSANSQLCAVTWVNNWPHFHRPIPDVISYANQPLDARWPPKRRNQVPVIWLENSVPALSHSIRVPPTEHGWIGLCNFKYYWRNSHVYGLSFRNRRWISYYPRSLSLEWGTSKIQSHIHWTDPGNDERQVIWRNSICLRIHSSFSGQFVDFLTIWIRRYFCLRRSFDWKATWSAFRYAAPR